MDSTSQTTMDTFLGLKACVVNMTQEKMEASLDSSYDNVVSMVTNDLSTNNKMQGNNKARLV